MEIKKSPKADLERNKSMYMLIGYVFILALIFVAFEWGSKDVTKHDLQGVGDVPVEEDIIPITMQQTPPPPPPPPAPVVEEIINIVEDDKEIAQVEIASTEDDQKEEQKIVKIAPAPVVEEDVEDTEIFTIVEEMPEFAGGETALLKYISNAVKYPVIAQENGIQGRVICTFVVNKDGKVVDAQVVRGVDPSLDKEALRVINSMPPWKPGKQRGKPVRVKYTLPVTFRLQ